VQNVSAVALDDQHTFIIECEFIPGSDAQGCLVVLVGESDNITVNLTRNSKVVTVEVANPPSSYLKVLAFDIERDGSVATLSIPGDIIIVNGKNVLQGLTLCTYTTGAYITRCFGVDGECGSGGAEN
jgi:hypothetical protein